MRKNILFLGSVIFFFVLANGCGIAEDHDKVLKAEYSDNEYLGETDPQAPIQYSVPRYDGCNYEGSQSIYGICVTCQTITESIPVSCRTAFFTFKLSNLETAQSVSLQLRVLAAYSASADLQIETITISAIQTTQDYTTWQNCHYNGKEYSPEGCVVPDFIRDEDFVLTDLGAGWYGIASQELKNYLEQNYNQGNYLSIVISDVEFTESQTNSFSVEFEDGENHGGSGEIPFMEFSY